MNKSTWYENIEKSVTRVDKVSNETISFSFKVWNVLKNWNIAVEITQVYGEIIVLRQVKEMGTGHKRKCGQPRKSGTIYFIIY